MRSLKRLFILLVIMSILTSCIPALKSTTSTTTTTTVTTTTTTTTTSKPSIDYLPNEDDGPQSDPYVDMTAEEFYADYSPATSYMDSYYRTLHNFMSGSIEDQEQAPTLADYQPMEDGKYVRNSSAVYSEDGNTYYVLDGEGNIANKIFRGGAYVTLDEVAAYVFAFGEIPANYISKKSGYPSSSPWGKYLRVNHSKFIGNTDKYPYEPELPDINGCGGDLQYFEMDIGTTGTDCDPGYNVRPYNDGNKITRGAARIVYVRYDADGNHVIDINEKYLFYTYNHYNDFQEYLNYEGGWGEMFGNITGGGTLSSKTDYNPTPYVEVVRRELWRGESNTASDEHIIELAFICFTDKKYFIDGNAAA